MLHDQAIWTTGHERGRDRRLGRRSALVVALRDFRWEPSEG